jgi:hypothetical protein
VLSHLFDLGPGEPFQYTKNFLPFVFIYSRLFFFSDLFFFLKYWGLNLVYTLRHSTILFLWCIFFFFFEKGSLELFVPAEILLISAS